MHPLHLAALSCVCADVFPQKGEIRPGGEALNFALAASRDAGVQAYVLGAVGTDACAQAIRRRLALSTVDATHLYTVPGATASNRIYLTPQGDRYFLPDSWTNGVYAAYRPNEADQALLRQMDVVHIHATSPALPNVLALHSDASFLLSVDFDDARAFDAWEALLPQLNVFFLSAEAAVLPRLEAWSVQYSAVFVATLAERGSCAFHQGHAYRTHAIPVAQVIDTTGCGDSYQAGFMVCYARNRSIQDALENGSRFAAQTISQLGGC